MKKTNTHIIYGLITALAMIVYSVILYVSGAFFNRSLGMVQYLIFLGGVILACINFSKANDKYVSFGQVFGAGFRTTAIITLLTTIWMFACISIFPDLKDKFVDMGAEQIAKQGTDGEAAEKGLSMLRDHFTLLMVGGTLFYNIVLGLIFSLIGAAVAPKKGSGLPPAA